jgi:hypothetical protein
LVDGRPFYKAADRRHTPLLYSKKPVTSRTR